jgi:hypothetical protein
VPSAGRGGWCRGHQGAQESAGKLFERNRLLQQVCRSELTGPVGKALLPEPGEHHHLRLGTDGADGGQGLDAVARRHRGVEEQQSRLVADHQADRLVPVSALADDLEETGHLEPSAD